MQLLTHMHVWSERIVCQITSDSFIKKTKKINFFFYNDRLLAVHNRWLIEWSFNQSSIIIDDCSNTNIV